MPLYKYTALKEKGKQARGIIDAETLEEAKLKLLKRQILITRVVESKKKNRSLKKQEVRSVTSELAHLLRAGLPLHESLVVLEEKVRGSKTGEILFDLSEKIRTGIPFSKALARHPQSFDVLYCSMIANAEQSGTFVPALEELSHLLDRQLHLRKTVIGALLYPALLSGFCLIVLSVLLFFVVPSLFDLFEGRMLHPFTQFVFSCSRFAVSAKWGLIGGFILVAGGITSFCLSYKGRIQLRAFFARIPLFRELFVKVALVRYFRAAATLLEGGLPALSALQQAKTSLRHPILEKSIQEGLDRLSQGESLEKALQGRPLIPSLIPRMLGIAQQAGNLSTMMKQVALIYEEDLEKIFSRITSLAQPVLLLILGAMVGFVLLSVLLPLTDVSSFVN